MSNESNGSIQSTVNGKTCRIIKGKHKHAENSPTSEAHTNQPELDRCKPLDQSLELPTDGNGEGNGDVSTIGNVKESEQDDTTRTERVRRDASALDYFICGGTGGLLAVLIGHPFDTMKVRLQTDPSYRSLWHCINVTFARDGVRGFYRGMSAPLATICPIFAVSFMGYRMGKTIVTQATGTREQDFRAQHFVIAGGFSGIITTLIMAPGERVKCLLQVAEQGAHLKKPTGRKIGPLMLIKNLYREDGLRAIYRGSCATMLRDIPGNGAYFATYELLWLMSVTHLGIDTCSHLTRVITMCAGGLSGMALWIIAMPGDVLKSRVQTAPTGFYPRGVRSAFTLLMKKEGPLALYNGLFPVMLRAFPANAACFLGFELMRSFILWAKNIQEC